MPATARKLKFIQFDLGGTQFECQLTSWQIVNNTPDGEKLFTFCPNGEVVEETDPDWSLELTFLSDWKAGGISDFLTQNDGLDAAFQLDHHADVVGEHVRWAGSVRVKAPSVGGDVRSTENTTVTLRCIGTPAYTRP